MPSFLKRLSSFTGKRFSSKSSKSSDHSSPSKSTTIDNNHSLPKLQRSHSLSNVIDAHAGKGGLKLCPETNNSTKTSSHSASPTISSSSSLSLSLPDSPTSISSYAPSRQQSAEGMKGTYDTKGSNSSNSNKQQRSHGPRQYASEPQFDHNTTEPPRPSKSLSSPLSGTQPTERTTFGPNTSLIPAVETTTMRNPALSVFTDSRSRSMPTLPDLPAPHVPTQPTGTVSDGQRDSSEDMNIIPVPRRRNSFALFSSNPANASSTSPPSKEKKMRPMSITSLFSLNNQLGSTRSRPPHQPKTTRWASRGGIGSKNEMLVELETTGVFVPSKGQRLREEFVYQTVTQCADEIRSRGLNHPNLFYNPAPKKVISSMIDLMTDQQRCNLFAIQCLRIDTVASLMLNVLSQMSNPVIPYSVMEHYFQQGLPTTRSSSSPSSRRHSAVLRMGLDELPMSMLAGLPAIPALPIMNHMSSGAPSHAIIAWARMHFDLAAFLGALPLMNRVILLEVLHVCHEVLEHQGSNRLTLARVVAQIAPALFSTVFDQKMLEKMVGGTRRCSIHCDSISSYEGNLAENHLLTVILVRFIYLTVNSRSNSTSSSPRMPALANHHQLRRKSSPSLGRSSYHSGSSGSSEYNGYDNRYNNRYDNRYDNTMYRRSQESIQQEQDAYYLKMARSFQEMEIQQRHQQQYGQYAQYAQYTQYTQYAPPPRQRRQRLRHHYNPEESIPEVEYAHHSKSIHPLDPANSNTGIRAREYAMPEPTLDTVHRDYVWHDRKYPSVAGVAV